MLWMQVVTSPATQRWVQDKLIVSICPLPSHHSREPLLTGDTRISAPFHCPRKHRRAPLLREEPGKVLGRLEQGGVAT